MVMVLVVVVFVLFGIGIQKLWTNSGKLCVIEYDRKYAGPPRGLWGPWANIKVGPMGEGGLGARPQEILRFYML